MDDLDIQKGIFRPICNKDEIDRVFSVKNADDYLLKLRAETIVDHMRLFRVYRNRALLDEENWSLEKSFDKTHYEKFLAKLEAPEREICNEVTYGDVFSTEPNGQIFSSEYGPIVTISNSLNYFLEFMHLALLEFETEVPSHIRMNSLRIAIRVMLQTEALDFDLDPRGIIPSEIMKGMQAVIPLQLQFIAGHEFSHFILGHLSEDSTVERPMFSAIGADTEEDKLKKIFTLSQQQEFDADIQAFLLPKYSEAERSDVLYATLLWFGSVELYEAARDVMFPPSSTILRTHPAPRERYENLLSKVPTPEGFDIAGARDFLELLGNMTQVLQEDITLHMDKYELEGSHYLDEPNTKWRGRELIDRVDY
jgi:hypothetical protein